MLQYIRILRAKIGAVYIRSKLIFPTQLMISRVLRTFMHCSNIPKFCTYPEWICIIFMTVCKLWNITCVNLLSFTAIRLQKWSDNKGTLKFFISFIETWNICGLTAYEASTTNCVGLKMSGWTLIYRVAISLLHTHFLTNAKVLVGTWLRHSVANTIYIRVHRTHWKQK